MANKKIPKTSVYKWEGKNRQGALLSGQMTGQDAVMIKALLRKQGITPSKVQKKVSICFVPVKRSNRWILPSLLG